MQILHLFCAHESEFVIKIEVQVKMNYYFIRKFTVMDAFCHAVKLGIVLKNFVLNLGLVSGSVTWAVTTTSLSPSYALSVKSRIVYCVP